MTKVQCNGTRALSLAQSFCGPRLWISIGLQDGYRILQPKVTDHPKDPIGVQETSDDNGPIPFWQIPGKIDGTTADGSSGVNGIRVNECNDLCFFMPVHLVRYILWSSAYFF